MIPIIYSTLMGSREILPLGDEQETQDAVPSQTFSHTELDQALLAGRDLSDPLS